MDIKSLYETKQIMLENQLKVVIEHPVTKGDQCENAWIDFFRSFLPNKYAIDKGFVFDCKGGVSEQIDIIIYDALYAPLIFTTKGEEKFITAESVYAVFDSKPKINKANLEYTNKKVKSVATLERTSRGMVNCGVSVPPRELTPILGGILASTAIKGAGALEKHLTSCPYIDLGCAVQDLSFLASRNKEGEISSLSISSHEETVLSFFYFILDERYKLGTVAAVDIREYANNTLESVSLEKDGCND